MVEDYGDGVRVLDRAPIRRCRGRRGRTGADARQRAAPDRRDRSRRPAPREVAPDLHVGRSALPELIGKTLPALAQRIEIDVRAKSLRKLGAKRGAADAARGRAGRRHDCACSRRWSTATRRAHASTAARSSTSTVRCRSATRMPSVGSSTGCATSSTSCPVGASSSPVARRSRCSRASSHWLRTDAKRRVGGEGGVTRCPARHHRQQARRRAVGRTVPPRPRSTAALRAWQAGIDVVPLRAVAGAACPRTWFDQHGERVADLLASRGERPQGPDLRAARSREARRRARPAAAAGARAACARCSTGFVGIPARSGGGRLRRRAPPVPAARRRLARVLPRGRTRLRARRRHGPRQDHPGARRAASAARKTLVVCPDQRAVQLDGRDPAVPPRPARRALPRHTPRARHHGRHRAHELPDPAQRHRRAQRDRVGRR